MKTKSNEGEGNADALIALLRRPGQWSKNSEIIKAIGWHNNRGNKSVTGHWKDLDEWLGPEDTMLAPNDGSTGHLVRHYSKRAVVLIGMRASTANGKAFRRWVADRVVDSLHRPDELFTREREHMLTAVSRERAFIAKAISNAVFQAIDGLGGGDHEKA